jgi:hypothetical protein
MSRGARNEPDDEDRWLEARERGERAPPIPSSTAARYDQLRSLLEDLPKVPIGAHLRPSWQQSVLDAIERGDGAPTPAPPAPQVPPSQSGPAPGGAQRSRPAVS